MVISTIFENTMTTKKIISFDIGIKNMAYCIFSVPQNLESVSINAWAVINLMTDPTAPAPIDATVYKCTCLKTKKRKLDAATFCGKTAKYSKAGNNYYCATHAKSASGFLLPKKDFSPTSLKKKKVDVLTKMCETYRIPRPTEKQNKSQLLDVMAAFFKEKCFEVIMDTSVKEQGAGEIDLITIGRNMARHMDILMDATVLDGITHVLMENQISTLASRMKTIQGMLAQYFIMRCPATHIEFISSLNKLKYFEKNSDKDSLETENKSLINDGEGSASLVKADLASKADPASLENTVISTTATISKIYKQHKIDGVYYAKQIIDKYPLFRSWKETLDTKKKDDLADCFLQGWWYITTKL